MTTQLATPGLLYGWAQPTVAADWTADMLERLKDDGWQYELVEGRVVRMPPPGPDRGHISWSIAHPLGTYVEAQALGAIYVGETGWDLTRRGERKDTVLASDVAVVREIPPGLTRRGERKDTVLARDVAVVRAERLPLPAPRRGKTYRPLAPDLVVEIASPTQYRPDLADKARHWLDCGVLLVWVVWPDGREVDIWMPGAAEPRGLRESDMLDSGDVIPGFRIQVSRIFG